MGRGDALLSPVQARGGLQCPAAHCHCGILVLSGQLPVHLAWDPWPLGKGVLKALLGEVLEAHAVGWESDTESISRRLRTDKTKEDAS